MTNKTQVWVRTRQPDGSYEGHEETINSSELDGAAFTGDPLSPQITLKNGRVFNIYAGNDGELGYSEEIDNSDPELIRKNREIEDARLKEYYEEHPDQDPKNKPLHTNCRCYEIYNSSKTPPLKKGDTIIDPITKKKKTISHFFEGRPVYISDL